VKTTSLLNRKPSCVRSTTCGLFGRPLCCGRLSASIGSVLKSIPALILTTSASEADILPGTEVEQESYFLC
jgi:hypothetical protein